MDLRRVFFALCVVLFCCSPGNAQVGPASTEGGYSHDSSRKTTNPDWMGRLANNKYANRITMPATHDTMALYGVDSVKTQTLSLKDQLMSGVRGLDIRCVISGDHLVIFHGSVYQNANFDDVLGAVTNFLAEHPGEAIYMRIKKERSADDDAKFETIFRTYLADERYSRYFYKPSQPFFWVTDANLTLGEIRGKILIFQDFVTKTDPGTRYGIDWAGLRIQDNWNLDTNWALYDKWNSIRDLMVAANTTLNTAFYANFLSGNGGSLPYFVASGKSSSGTDDPLLWTGLTTAFGTNKNTYPDFPRKDCLFNACSIYFLGTNELTSRWLRDNRYNVIIPHRAGIIFADFPGPELIKNAIDFNVY